VSLLTRGHPWSLFDHMSVPGNPFRISFPLRLIPILERECDRVACDVSELDAKRLVERGHAKWDRAHRGHLRYTVLGEEFNGRPCWQPHPCRTHTAPARELGALGGQVYTTRDDRRRVDGFRHLDKSDVPTFYSAILECRGIAVA